MCTHSAIFRSLPSLKPCDQHKISPLLNPWCDSQLRYKDKVSRQFLGSLRINLLMPVLGLEKGIFQAQGGIQIETLQNAKTQIDLLSGFYVKWYTIFPGSEKPIRMLMLLRFINA